MIIGITGLIGAGKSTAAEFFREMGAVVIDADLIGRRVVDNSLTLRKKLVSVFGSDVLTARGNLRRTVVAKRAFANLESRELLDSIVHPVLLKELRRQVKAAQKNNRMVVIDAALLLKWNLDREVDTVLLVHASLKTRISRLEKRGLSRTDAVARTNSQRPYTYYRKRADIVVFNNGFRDDLFRKLRSKLVSLI